MTCKKCGSEIELGSAFCGFCGEPCPTQTTVEEATPPVTSSDWQTYDVFEEDRKTTSKKRTVLFVVGFVWLGLVLAAWGVLAAYIVLGMNVEDEPKKAAETETAACAVFAESDAPETILV